MIPKRLIDPIKAQQLLGFRASTSMEEGLRRTVAWYRSNLTAKSPA
jgi:nucleoside-diphosphate-sugar epimerase